MLPALCREPGINNLGPTDHWEVVVDRFPNANIELYRHLIAASERDPKRDENRHKMLLTLLAEEDAKIGNRCLNDPRH
jgi:hypothetical protein